MYPTLPLQSISPPPFSTIPPTNKTPVLSFLTTRANAIRMLQSRISTLSTSIRALPRSYLNTTDSSSSSSATHGAPPPHQLLRAALALKAKLSLVSAAGQGLQPDGTSTNPSNDSNSNPSQNNEPTSALSAELLATQSDAAIVALLASLGRRAQQAKELGAKAAMREGGRRQRGFGGEGMGMGMGMSGMGMDDEMAEFQMMGGGGAGGAGGMEF